VIIAAAPPCNESSHQGGSAQRIGSPLHDPSVVPTVEPA